MEMTAPVLVKIPEETKMWEPAVYTLNFPLPAAYQDKPPAPTNDKVSWEGVAVFCFFSPGVSEHALASNAFNLPVSMCNLIVDFLLQDQWRALTQQNRNRRQCRPASAMDVE